MSSEKYLVGFSKELDFRPIECVDLHSTRYCCLCNVVPTVTFLLGCSHAFCELCYENLLGTDRRCPLDETDFEQDDVSKLTFKAKRLERTTVRCFNAKNGCNVVGTIQEVESHFFDECAYYAVICTRCKASVLRRDIVSHCGTSCRQGNTSSVSSIGVHIPITGCSFDPVKETFVSVESVLKKVSTVEHQLHGYAEEIDSLKEMALRNEQLLNRLLENQERVAADVGNTENKVTQQVQDQAEIKGSLRGVAELLSVVELQMSSISRDNVATSAVNKNVEQVSERVGNLMDTLQQISATLNDVKGIKGELNPLLQCSAELTKFTNADEEAREKMLLVKAILGTSTEIGIVAQRVYALYSSVVPQKMEAFFHIGDIFDIALNMSRQRFTFGMKRSSVVFVLCGYSVRLRAHFIAPETLSLRFSLCKSQSDALLKWPFTIPFTCRFMHPRDSSKHIVCRTVHPKADLNGGCNNGAYCRPTDAENDAVLIEPAPSVTTLRADGFMHDHSVCIGIRLHPEMA
ncbi:uncharacterized protein LOC135393425 [Ornithodoros turicata]|uniref:uncharacterized protein LOC135393425 n=1 Tax=Ornithodoros turicata TaxID=34597 RepID=UPI00313991F3